MINWKLKLEWFVAAIVFVFLYFIFAMKQDYGATTIAHLAGLQPSMKYHLMAILSICTGAVCYGRWIMAQLSEEGVEN